MSAQVLPYRASTQDKGKDRSPEVPLIAQFFFQAGEETDYVRGSAR